MEKLISWEKKEFRDKMDDQETSCRMWVVSWEFRVFWVRRVIVKKELRFIRRISWSQWGKTHVYLNVIVLILIKTVIADALELSGHCHTSYNCIWSSSNVVSDSEEEGYVWRDTPFYFYELTYYTQWSVAWDAVKGYVSICVSEMRNTRESCKLTVDIDDGTRRRHLSY